MSRCFMGPTAIGESDSVTTMVKTALDLGYRHIDTVNAACVGHIMFEPNRIVGCYRLQITVRRTTKH